MFLCFVFSFLETFYLGGGFKHFLCFTPGDSWNPIWRLRIFFNWVVSTQPPSSDMMSPEIHPASEIHPAPSSSPTQFCMWMFNESKILSNFRTRILRWLLGVFRCFSLWASRNPSRIPEHNASFYLQKPQLTRVYDILDSLSKNSFVTRVFSRTNRTAITILYYFSVCFAHASHVVLPDVIFFHMCQSLNSRCSLW